MAKMKRLFPWVMVAICLALILAIFAVVFSAYVWAADTVIPPEPEPPTALQLTSMCSDDPALTRAWRVRNPNAFDVDFTWKLYGTSIDGAGVAPASADYFFETPTQPGPNTLIIFVAGIQQAVKASGGQQCVPPTPVPPALSVTGTCNSGIAEFQIANAGGDMPAPATWWMVTATGGAATCYTDIAHGYAYSGTLQLAAGDKYVLTFGAVGGLPPKLCVESAGAGVGFVAAVAEPAEACTGPTAIETEPEIMPLRRVFVPWLGR